VVYAVTTTSGGGAGTTGTTETPTPTPTPSATPTSAPTPAGPTPATHSGLFGADTPQTATVGESLPVELGVSFTPSVSGAVTAISFYKGPGNGGAHVGHLWTASGGPLATVSFSGETDAGWQTAPLASPVALVAGQTYVVSYFAPQGNYSYTSDYFQTAKTTGPLTAAASGNGRYLYGANGGFPTDTYGSANYFVDVDFVPNT
jgi:hypothetical protein